MHSGASGKGGCSVGRLEYRANPQPTQPCPQRCLQLINNGNVRIIKLGASGQGGQEGECFTLTLLDRVLPHKRVANYRALGGAGAPAAAAAEAQVECGRRACWWAG